MYNNEQIQCMLDDLSNTPARKELFMSKLNCGYADKLAIQDVICDGWYERFDRYDSGVCEIFISTYESIK